MRKVIRVLGDFRIRFNPNGTTFELGVVKAPPATGIEYGTLSIQEAHRLAQWIEKMANFVDGGSPSEG